MRFARYLRTHGYTVTVLAAGESDGREGDILRVGLRHLGPVRRQLGPKVLPDETLQSWLPEAFRTASRVIRDQRVDALVSSAPPMTGHAVALLCHYEFPDLPWIADFRDGWLRDGPTEVGGFQPMNRYLERRIVHDASLVTCVTEPLARDFRNRYPGVRSRVVTVSNGYDPVEFRDATASTFGDGAPGPSFTMAYTGSLSKTSVGMRLDPLLDGLRQARGGLDECSPRMRLLIAGDLTPDEQEQLRRAGQELEVSYLGYLTPAAARGLQLGADLLVVVAPPRRTVATSKLFDYIAAGKPILCIGEGSVAASIVRAFRLGIVVDRDPRAVADALRVVSAQLATGERIVDDADVRAAREAFSCETLSAQFCGLLERLTREKEGATGPLPTADSANPPTG